MAARTAASSSADATGPSDANHTSSIDSSRARIARATSPATRGAFSSPCASESASSSPDRSRGCSAFTGSASAPCSRSPASTSSSAHRVEVRLGPRRRGERLERRAKARERARELRVLCVERLERLGRRRAPLPVRGAGETAVRSASACSQHCASAPSAIIGSAVASCSSIAGRSMTSAHHAANGPSHRTSSTSPSAVPRVVSTRRQNSALETRP